MIYIRQNTPFVLVWEIELQGTAIKLADTKVSVIASCARGRIDLTDYIDSIEENTITINQNKGLAFIGDYSLMTIIKSENLTTLKVQEKYVFRTIAKNDPTETESLVSIRSSIVASGGYDSALSEVSQNAIQNAPVAKEFGKVYQAIEELQEETKNTIKESVEEGIEVVLGGVSEAYDTLKEIEEYIERDEAGAVALAQSITRLETEKVSKEDIDSALSTTSENPVMNKVITEELGKKLEGEVVGTTSPTEGTVGGSYDDTEIKEQLAELSAEITQHTLIGKGNTSVQQDIKNLLPNKKYRIHFLNPAWSVANLTISGFAKLSISWEIDGKKEYVKYVDLADSVADYYDFTMPSQNVVMSVVVRADENIQVPFVIEDIDYSEIFNFVKDNLDVVDTSREYFDIVDVLEYGNVQNLSAGTNMSYLDSTTRVRLKATTKIRLREGDIVASDDTNIKIYVGAFNLDGTFKPYGWSSFIQVEKDCDAIIMARYEVEAEIDIDVVKRSLYVRSAKQSLRDSLLKDVDVNNVESLVGFPLQGTTRVRFPQWVKGKPMPITLTYMAEVTGSGQPYITCEVGAYASTRYIVENRRVQQMRIPPMLNGMDGFFMISVPNGTTLTFKNIAFNNDYQSWKEDVGIRLNSHLGFLRYAPEQTLISFEMAALMGYNACIVNPIKTSDGVWMCYHEDKAYLSADGTNDNKIALTGSQFNAKSYAEIRQYSVIPYKSMQTYWGNHPIPTLDEFFQVCTRTKMRPMFSVHPDLNNDDWQQVRKMLIKRNLLNSLTIKVFGDESLQTAYTNMGKDVKGYVYITYLTTKDEAVQLINKLNTSFAELHGILGVEIGSESAQTEEIIGLFIEAGYPVTVGTYSPIDTSVYKRLMSYGVTEFTDDLLPCGSMLF